MSLDIHLKTKDLDNNELGVFDYNITHNLGEMASS
jgi:hypothetical protein